MDSQDALDWAQTEGIPVVRWNTPSLAFHTGDMSSKGYQQRRTVPQSDYLLTGNVIKNLDVVKKGGHGVFGNRLESIEAYEKFKKAEQVAGFDIETLGRGQVTEIGIAKRTAEGMENTHLFVKPDNMAELNGWVDKVKQDPFAIWQMDAQQQRTIADLTRYSSLGEGFSLENGTHNQIVDEMFKDERLIVDKLATGNYIEHIESGLNQVSTFMDPKEAVGRLNEQIKPGVVFAGHNSREFDVPVLQEWAKRNGGTLNEFSTHLDFYDLLKTVNPDMSMPRLEAGILKSPLGDMKLQSLVQVYGLDSAAHNALGDAGEQGLLGVIDKMEEPIREALDESKAFNGQGLLRQQAERNQLVTSKRRFIEGNKLYSPDWLGEYSGAYSVEAETNRLTNEGGIQARSLVTFQGYEEVADGDGNKKISAKFFDEAAGQNYAIVGDDIHHLQERLTPLMPTNKMGAKTLQAIESERLDDLARRRYEDLFSMRQRGSSERATKGAYASKRMYENAVQFDALEKQGQSVEEIMGKLDFASQWDPERKTYTHNAAEARDFMRLKDRLLAESDVMLKIINEIETDHGSKYLQYQEEGNQNMMRQTRQQVEETFSKLAPDMVAQDTKQIMPAIGRERLPFFNPIKGEMDSLNASSPRKLGNDLINRTRMTKAEKARAAKGSGLKGEALDQYVAEKEKALMTQRLNALRPTLQDATGVGMKAITNMHTAFELYSDPFTLARHIGTAIHSDFEKQTVEVRSIDVPSEQVPYNETKVRQAIDETKQAYEGTQFIKNEVAGSKLRLGEEIGQVFNEIDKAQPKPLGSTFEWNGRHKESTERIISALQEGGALATTTYDAGSKNLVVYGYDQKNADSVRTAIARGEVPKSAAKIEIPVVRDGQFTYGRQALNARPKLDWEGKVVVHTPASMVADEVEARMAGILRDIQSGDPKNASKTARRAALDGIERFAGAQGLLEVNDTLDVLNTPADRLKQHAIDADQLVTKLLVEQGTLNQDDFIRPIYSETGKPQNISIKFLKTDAVTKLHENAPRVLKEQGIDAFYGGVKSDHAMKLILGLDDVRDLIPGGSFLNPARDNPIQNFNSFLMTDDALEKVEVNVREAGGYFSKEPLMRTPKGEEFFGAYDAIGKKASFNIEAIPMSHKEIRQRWEEMALNPEYHQRMIDEGYLIKPTDMHRPEAKRFEGYVLDPVKTPTTYENQGVLARDVEATKMDYKRVLSGDFQLSDDLVHGQEISPGQVIGQMRDDRGVMKGVRWEQTNSGRLYVSEGEVGVSFKESAFKYLADTEKFTEQRHDRWVVEGLTGSKTASLIFDPAIKKHQDFGIWMNGRSRMVVPALQQGFEQADDATKIRLQGKLADAGLQYDTEKKRLLDMRGGMDSFDPEKLNTLLDDDFFGAEKGFKTSKGDERMIMEVIGSNVAAPAKMVQDGKKILGFNKEGDPIFGRPDGISVGWRELNTLGEQGMTETRGAVMQQMLNSGNEKGSGPVSATSNERIRNTYMTLEATTAGVEAPVKTIHDFNPLPDADYSMSAYKGTIFDLEGKGAYLELPEVKGADGEAINYTYETGVGKNKTRQNLNGKLFIPKTGLTGADGKYYMDALNQHVAAIFRKAEQVSKSTSSEKQRIAQEELQGTIDNYFKAVKHDLSSSKGFVGEHGVKARMDGLSGLYKMSDPSMSKDLVGDFEFLTDKQAKAMGILDKLNAGEEVFGMTTRYPSFHKDSMVPVQYRLGGTDERFITGSAYAGEKHRADMDGDGKHTSVISTEENVQAEMKKAWETKTMDDEARYQKFLTKQLQQNPQFSWQSLLGDVPEFQAMGVNTSEEVAAKVGRGIVGMLSDFNLEMRQLGGEAFGVDDGRYKMMAELGEMSEQKLISSKHGLNLVDGKLPAIAFLDHVRAGTIESHEKALDLAKKMFGEDTVKESNIAGALDASREAMGKVERNLKDPGFNFGKSRGVGNSMDLAQMQEFVQANPGVNSYREQLQNILDSEVTKPELDVPSDRSPSVPEAIDTRRRGGGPNPPPGGPPPSGGPGGPPPGGPRPDGPGGGPSGGGPKPPLDDGGGFWKNAKGKKAIAIGAGVALMSVAGYNMLKDDTLPTQGGVGQSTAKAASYEPPKTLKEFSETPRGYDVQVRTSGAVKAERVEGALQQYGSGNLSVTRQDNTKQLNSLFYRDQVESHI